MAMTIDMNDWEERVSRPKNVKEELLKGTELCGELYLRTSGSWLSAALLTFEEPEQTYGARGLSETFSTPLISFDIHAADTPFTADDNDLADDASESNEESSDEIIYNAVMAALAMERFKEASVLAQEGVETNAVLRFIYFYAKFLHIERSRLPEYAKTELGEVDRVHIERMLEALLVEIERYFDTFRNGSADAALHYLYGKILLLQDQKADAVKKFVDAISFEPLLVEVWMEMADCMENRAEIVRVGGSCPNHWMRYLFFGRSYGNVGHIDYAFNAYEMLQKIGLKNHPDIKNSIGKLNMNNDPDDSINLMESVRNFNPYRMHDVDSYSHLLFIMDDRVRMRKLADDVFEGGRFSPECCIALGNFFSLLGDHEKAIQNFNRALRYNPDLHHVWTLIGHEHVELKQTDLAMRSYSNAIEANPNEYRAWYGLGQAQEILRAHSSALYYFKHAFEYCPNDTRMLLALADTFQILENYTDAEMCYWRAYQIEGDTVVLVRLAKMFEKLGRYGRAAEIYVKFTADVQAMNCDEVDGAIRPVDREDSEDVGCAYLYLSKYYLLHRMFDKAFEEAKAAEVFREVREEAHALLKQISRMRAESEMDNSEMVNVDPARLGFPLWADTSVV
ncbi:cell division cycle protein 23 homolog [Paramacrobiotus metropolitanus]|uniref:cell division cycle protein 23 homolog n=1 Tax=Paramacrobiotus metropolitanus TaxID=2943436 RepID=UPI0024461E29|nr:cell division cycle protein 23 homolog [Paramacrobiotus metropolitanus]